MSNNQLFSRAKSVIIVQAMLITLLSFLFNNDLSAGVHLVRERTDTIPFADVDVDRWKQVVRLDVDNGALIGSMQNGEKLRMNRNQYLDFARKTGKVESGQYEKLFTRVEIEPEYPGGSIAWNKYLLSNLHYPEDAVKNEVQGIIVVQFIVEADGSLTEVESVSGPTSGALREEAVKLVRNSGKWNPAIQNLRVVRAFKKQPVLFRLR